jgi:predicted  nucleic acid-binding Zn-ribbon protein
MVDAPDNLIFEYLRRLDAKLDRIIEDIGDLKIRVTAVEERLARTDVAVANLELSIAGVNRRIDRVEARLERIERRLDLVELPH